jgi:hypothetical protein
MRLELFDVLDEGEWVLPVEMKMVDGEPSIVIPVEDRMFAS